MYFTMFSARYSKYIKKQKKKMIEHCFVKICRQFLTLRKTLKIRDLKREAKTSRERSQGTPKRDPKMTKIAKKHVNSSKNEHAKKHENGTKKSPKMVPVSSKRAPKGTPKKQA